VTTEGFLCPAAPLANAKAWSQALSIGISTAVLTLFFFPRVAVILGVGGLARDKRRTVKAHLV
jgi:hypothetical protein